MRHANATRKAKPTSDARSRTVASAALDGLRRHAWLLAAMAPFALFWIVEFSRYVSLPDPLFGGDSWQQLGIAYHIYNGEAPWTDAYFQGEWAFRDWLMFALVAGIAKVTTLDPIKVAIFWPIVPLLAGGAATYFLGRRLFGHQGLALFMAVAWMGISPFMAFQSSAFAAMAMVPLFLLALVSQDGSLKRRLLLGAAYATAALSYLVAFFGCTLILLVVLAHTVWKQGPKRAFAAAWPVAAVATPVILALWGPLLLVYHGHVLNPSHIYSDSGRGWNAEQALGLLVGFVFDTTNVFAFALGALAALGLYAAGRQWESRGGKWAFLVLGVGLVGSFHYVLTMPLFGTHLVFFRWPKIFLALAKLLLAAQALAFLAWSRDREEHRPQVVAGALGLVVLASAFTTPLARSSYTDLATMDDVSLPAVLETARWARAHLSEDAVVLAQPEESFAIHGLTGVHVVTTRRSHANTFVDMDQRMADAAVMIYGTDRAKARELMDRYHVTHAYIGWFYEQNQGEEPIATSPAHEQYWRENGVPFDRDVWPLDPSGPNVQLFDLLLVNATGTTPPMLEDFTPIQRTTVGETVIMTLYERKE